MADERISEQELQEATAQLQYLQGVYSQRYEILNEQMAAYTMARDAVARSLELLSKAESLGNSSILVNAEGGAYIEAGIKAIDRVVTYVGAGYLVEKTVPEAKAFLEVAAKNSDGTISRLAKERQKVEKELFEISYRMTALRQG